MVKTMKISMRIENRRKYATSELNSRIISGIGYRNMKLLAYTLIFAIFAKRVLLNLQVFLSKMIIYEQPRMFWNEQSPNSDRFASDLKYEIKSFQ